ncbi:hypothetical protein [Actinacidiphila sp. bgisy160]|uniref:hypothetical protein n=1 Tax=Actinacidiphila sp. bgisy160 TaxID=3413796 RepID=UPI003D758ABC
MSSGPFDVRVFSSAPEFRPRRGVVCIRVAQDADEARRYIAQAAADGYTAAAFEPDTGIRVALDG